jgi:hypothetical protein
MKGVFEHVAKKKDQNLDSLTITSPDGAPRMMLGTDPTHGLPLMEFFGDDGITRRLCLGLNREDTPFLCMLRKDGTAAVGMGVAFDDADPGLTVYHPNGLPAVKVWLRASGEIDMEIFDRNDKVSKVRIDQTPKETGPSA